MITQGDKLPMPDDDSNEFAHPKKLAFLAAYAELGNVSAAAKSAEIARRTHYQWLKNDGQYAQDFAEAHANACESLEAEARRRAVEGYEEPVFHKGEVCGTVQKYSDTLLIFLMKGAMPEKYRERMEHSGPGGGAIPFSHSDAINTALDDAERLELLELRALARSGHARAIRHEGQRGPMADGSAPPQAEPGVN